MKALLGVLLFGATLGWYTTREREVANQRIIYSISIVNFDLSVKLRHVNDSVVGLCPRCGWEIKSTFFDFKDKR